MIFDYSVYVDQMITISDLRLLSAGHIISSKTTKSTTARWQHSTRQWCRPLRTKGFWWRVLGSKTIQVATLSKTQNYPTFLEPKEVQNHREGNRSHEKPLLAFLPKTCSSCHLWTKMQLPWTNSIQPSPWQAILAPPRAMAYWTIWTMACTHSSAVWLLSSFCQRNLRSGFCFPIEVICKAFSHKLQSRGKLFDNSSLAMKTRWNKDK